MPDSVFQLANVFPVATTVSAGSTEDEVVAADGTLTYTGLTAGQPYVLSASGITRTVRVNGSAATTGPPNPTWRQRRRDLGLT